MPERSLSGRVVAATTLVGLALTACASVEGKDIGSPIFNGTTPDGEVVEPPITTLPIPQVDALRVPVDHFTIQEAVDAAQPGDLVLIDPGVYTEEVFVTSPDIVIRGRNRGTVFVDGLHESFTGITVQADGVAIENLTVRNYTNDAIAVDAHDDEIEVNGFRAQYVTTSNTGRHGITTSNAVNVHIRDVWASGHGGAGVSISNCSACSVLVEATTIEYSARGVSVSGAEGGVSVVRSTIQNNRTGIVLEDGLRQTVDAVIGANRILNNGFSNTPTAQPNWDHAFGVGIHLSGTFGSRIEFNRISGNTRVGVLLGTSPTSGRAEPVEFVVEDNDVAEHPEGAVLTEPTWTTAPRSSIPYQNGPVPQPVAVMPDPDSAPPVPAGPVLQPDLGELVLPAP